MSTSLKNTIKNHRHFIMMATRNILASILIYQELSTVKH